MKVIDCSVMLSMIRGGGAGGIKAEAAITPRRCVFIVGAL